MYLFFRPFLQEQVAPLKVSSSDQWRELVPKVCTGAEVVGLVVGDLVGFRVRVRGMEEEGKLGGGGWWSRACVRVVPAGFFYSESGSGC